MSTSALSLIQRIHRNRRQSIGLWFNDVDPDEAFTLLSDFASRNLFFDDYTERDLFNMLTVMDVLRFNPGAPITKQGGKYVEAIEVIICSSDTPHYD